MAIGRIMFETYIVANVYQNTRNETGELAGLQFCRSPGSFAELVELG